MDVRWLSEGKVLVLFINMTNEEKTFLKTKISLVDILNELQP
jgi:hypothetical protein